MNFLLYLSDYIIPFVIFYIVGFGILMKVHVFDEFVEGAEDGFKLDFDVLDDVNTKTNSRTKSVIHGLISFYFFACILKLLSYRII